MKIIIQLFLVTALVAAVIMAAALMKSDEVREYFTRSVKNAFYFAMQAMAAAMLLLMFLAYLYANLFL